MSKKYKVSDEQIIEKLQNPDLSYKQIAEELGVAWAGTFNNRCKQIAKNNGLPDRTPKKRGNPNWGKKQELPPAEDPQPLLDEQFPFNLYDSVIWGGKLHSVVRIDAGGFVLRGVSSLKSTYITFEQYEKRKTEFVRGSSAPVKCYKLDEVKEQSSVGEIQVNGQAIKELSNEDKEKIVEAFTAPEPVPQEKEPDPVSIDLELEDSADPVEPPREEPDYVDPEWFDKPIPRKGTVERAIWDKAYREICEIQTLRSTIQSALNRGDRLPGVEVDRYNKYVSKYSEEVCV